MTTVDDPMPLNDALRIIRNVSEHNTREIPSQADIAEALRVVGSTDADHMRVMQQGLALLSKVVVATDLIRTGVRDPWMIKKAISDCHLELVELESAWMIACLGVAFAGDKQ